MTDQQLYLAIGVPSLVALIGIVVNISYFVVLNARIGSLEMRIGNMETRQNSMEGKLVSLAEHVAGMKVLLDIVLRKLDELEARIIK